MQSLNDDMDDLFRKAAENYPLKTDNADWDKVLGRLNAPETPLPAAAPKSNNGYKKLLWLLLLIPVGVSLMLVREYPGKKGTAKFVEPSKKEVSNETDKSNSKTIDESANNSQSNNSKTIITDNNNISRYSTKTEIDNDEFTLQRLSRNQVVINDGDISHSLNDNTRRKEESAIYTDSLNKQEGNAFIITPKGNDAAASGNVTNNSANASATQQTGTEAVTDTADTVKKDSPAKDTALQKQATTKKKTESYSPQKGLYLSFIGGPDISTVKGQKMDWGYSIGFLAGYRFSKKLSAELGLLWDKKSYYSDGKYFKTNKLALPNHTIIINVDGYCKMFEIPVGFRYDFATGKKGSFFATAGASTYLMQKEGYDYVSTRYNVIYTGYKSYDKSTNNWFSIINITAGYEKKISKTGSIRIEPYLKIPASGIGIGSLPVTSFGVYAGFTKHFK